MASTYLTFTQQTPTGDAAKKFTLSMWVKKCENGINQGLWGNTYDSTHRGYIFFNTGDYLGWWDSSGPYILTNRRFRDINSFYHIVWSIDSTQSSSSDRVKLWINGVQETSFSQNTYPAQDNANMKIVGTTNTPYMGKYLEGGTNNYFEGIISHVHFTQGYCYDASTFGEEDSSTGEWKIKTSPSIANYGTNGFWWLKDSIATTDHSPNSNVFSVGGGTLTKTEDCPSNVFATLDPLNVPTSNAPTFTNGNTKVVTSSGGQFGGSSNLGASSGKYYFEIKFVAESGSQYGNISLSSSSNARERARQNVHSNQLSATYPNLCYEYDGNVYKDSGSSAGSFGTYSTGDIIIIAMDLDNQKAYFGKNGTWGNSSDPTSGATGTGAVTLSANSDFWHLALGDRNSSGTATYEVNFGNGYFGTTAVSSAGTNASGIGIFEYDVPTGYTALSTKGLNL